MKHQFLYALAVLSVCSLTACIEKQPIDPRYYHQTQGIPYQNGEESPFTEAEIAQAKKDDEALAAALADTSSTVDTNRWKNEIHRICLTDMGFAFGTPSYTTCHDFYYQQAALYGINTNAITVAQINAFLQWTNPIIHGCRGYGYVGDVLWGCVHHGEYRHYHHWHHHYQPHHSAPHHSKPAPHHSKPASHHKGPEPHHSGHHATPAPHGDHKGPSHSGGPSGHFGHGGGPKH